MPAGGSSARNNTMSRPLIPLFFAFAKKAFTHASDPLDFGTSALRRVESGVGDAAGGE